MKLDAAAYAARNGFEPQPLRFHHLHACGRSPMHAQHALKGGESEETRSMTLGSITHHLVASNFGRLAGFSKIVVYPGAVRRGKEWEAFREKHEGKGDTIVTGTEMDAAKEMATALIANPLARRLIRARGVHREQTLYFDMLGRACRATPDLRAHDGSWIAELKTTRSADPDRFRWDCIRFGYHAQMAMQLEGVRSLGFPTPRKAFVIAVESTAPYPVTVMQLTDDSILAGAKDMRLWLERTIGCELAGHWPPYAQSIVKLDVVGPEPDLVYAEEPEPEPKRKASR